MLDGTGAPLRELLRPGRCRPVVRPLVGTGGNCGPAGSWACQVVDATGDAGQHNSIAVRQAGTMVEVRIAYHQVEDNALKVARGECTAATCSFTNQTIQASSSGFTFRGKHTSVAFSQSGWPYISYQVGTSLSLQVGESGLAPARGRRQLRRRHRCRRLAVRHRQVRGLPRDATPRSRWMTWVASSSPSTTKPMDTHGMR